MPPSKPHPAPPSRQLISRQLRAALQDTGLTAYAIGRDSGVDAGVIQRFLNEERDIRLETLDRLADHLGLRLVETGRGRARPSKSPRPRSARGEPHGYALRHGETAGDDAGKINHLDATTEETAT